MYHCFLPSKTHVVKSATMTIGNFICEKFSNKLIGFCVFIGNSDGGYFLGFIIMQQLCCTSIYLQDDKYRINATLSNEPEIVYVTC